MEGLIVGVQVTKGSRIPWWLQALIAVPAALLTIVFLVILSPLLVYGMASWRIREWRLRKRLEKGGKLVGFDEVRENVQKGKGFLVVELHQKGLGRALWIHLPKEDARGLATPSRNRQFIEAFYTQGVPEEENRFVEKVLEGKGESAFVVKGWQPKFRETEQGQETAFQVVHAVSMQRIVRRLDENVRIG